MRIAFQWLSFSAVFFLMVTAVAADNIPTAGSQLAPIRLAAPETDAAANYLGIGREAPFDPLTIRGSLLVIEIFSMYCPHCQREAPTVNQLYQTIEASSQLAGRVKLIGIGVGNSSYEVNHFRKHYKVPFPLFADEEFSVHKAIGEVRTPFFIIVSTHPDDRGIVLGTIAGGFGTVKSFITRLEGFMEQR